MNKEADNPHEQEPDPRPEVPELVYRYEDGYDAEIHPTFASLSRQFSEYAEGPFAAYNVPVWLDYDDQAEVATVSIGLMLTRHGLCMLWRAPATPEEFRGLQVRMLGIWADRADLQFGRWLWKMDRAGEPED